MKITLNLIWYIASILLIYSACKYTLKYHFLQLNIKEIINAIKSKSNNNISSLSSLCISLAAKIGVGSLSGVALAIYFGGVGTIFWIMIISLLISINTYVECELGMKYRTNNYLGGPSYYIKKCLNNKYLSYIYSILIIITYSVLFLSIQTNTIVSTFSYFSINKNYVVIILLIIIMLIIKKGIKGISKANTVLVPLMLIFYLIIGGYVFILNIDMVPNIIKRIISEVLNLKSIIPVFLIGIERAIFITESSIGTSAISASICDNDKQGMYEVLGNYIIVFMVSLTTFIIIATSNYEGINVINGIDLVLYAFNYHFDQYGVIFLAIITIFFAFSTIISSYYFGESNLKFISNKKIIRIIYPIIFLLVIIISSYIKIIPIWNLTSYFLGILVIINIASILAIKK